MQFQKTECPCLDRLMYEIQSTEQTQELRLSDGMPDVGRVLAAWGQPVLRSKEWRRDSIVLSGGILMWVLYAPEDGSEARCVDSWLPFQLKLDLPEDCAEGKLRVHLLPKYSDSRALSARKLMLRSGASVMVQAYVPQNRVVMDPVESPQGVELLQNRYPLRVLREIGEKPFRLDEDLALPGSAPLPEKIICYHLFPEVTDQKVSGDKVVFRGNGNLHILYRSEEGQLHNWDFSLPFSQYAPLDGEYSAEARADVILCPTSVELDLDGEGHMQLKCGMTGQYLIDDRQIVQVVEDAYSPGREVQLQREELTVPVVLENRRENIYAEQLLPVNMNLAADIRFLPDYPRLYPDRDGLRMEVPGTFQMLYYDENGALQGASGRWEGSQWISADRESQLSAMPILPASPQLSLGEGTVVLKSELPMTVTSMARQQIPMVTDIALGAEREPDPNRPSLILQRAETGSLWHIAKNNGSTMEAIRKANGLQQDPVPGQMLLIPVS